MVSNGYDIAIVNTALQGRIGWLQPTLEGSPVLTTANKASSTGRYYNDGSFHSAITIDKLKSAQEDADITDTEFNAYLQTIDQSIIAKCLSAVFNKPQLIEKTLLYQRLWNRLRTPLANEGKFCGWRISIAQGDYTVEANNIGLWFDAVGTFNLYLFNDLILAPLQTKSVTTVANSETIVSLNWIMSYISANNMGGVFYVGYFQDDLLTSGVGGTEIHALDEQLTEYANTKIFGAIPFQSAQTGALDFNRDNTNVIFRNYGINLDVSSYYDYTQKIAQNAHLFDELRGIAMGIYAIEQIKQSVRYNNTERAAKAGANYEADLSLAFPTKDFPFVAGLKAQYGQAIKQIRETFFPKMEAMSVSIGCHSGETYEGYNINNLPARGALR